MATKKKAAKAAAKPARPSAGKPAKPVKKAVKAKPAAKKVVKPAAKKPAPKPASKPVAKKKAPAKAVKPVAKKKVPAKVVKPVKKAVKPIVKSISKKPVAIVKPVQKPMPKKEEKKTVAPLPDLKSALKAFKAKEEKFQKSAKPIAMPKITTKTSRSYQPDFTRSVLDQPKYDTGASIVRYNDTDLNEFKELIQRKMEAAKKELAYLQGLITRKDEMGGDETDNRYMTMEDGSLSMEREQLSQMASRQITFIDHLEKALMRIENKTYGICRVTGKLIDKARLKAVPHATLSIEAKMGIVR